MRVAQAVRWDGIEVTSVNVCYHPPATLLRGTGHAVRAAAEESECSDEGDAMAPSEFAADFYEFGPGKQQVENICALRPIQSLANDHQHNQNLVMQYRELACSFKAWHPVRGDGNCYYRAVLFSWLERSIALGTLDNLRYFNTMLKPHRKRTIANLAFSIRTCRRLLKGWIASRSRCMLEVEVRQLLAEVSDEFNNRQTDHSFILCLRHLIAEYLQQHAHDPVSSSDAGNTLTYESWAQAMGSQSITDYCQHNVYAMNQDAADHVQLACPCVLRTTVRICMVDRQTARCNFIDYGEGSSKGSGDTVKSAADLAIASGHFGRQAEIFLLFKPGHYDILVPVDGVGKFLDPNAIVSSISSQSAGIRPDVGTHPVGESAQTAYLRHASDVKWRGLVRLTGEICDYFQAVLRCLEDKLVEELTVKQRRFGSLDESLFEGQLTSVLDPLRDALMRFQRTPEESSFNGEREVPYGTAAQNLLLPSLVGFFSKGGLDMHSSDALDKEHSSSGSLWQQPESKPQEDRNLSTTATMNDQSHSPLLTTPLVKKESDGKLECCFCLDLGASAVAACGCAYHPNCLADYAHMEAGKSMREIACHIHEQLLGDSFLTQHIPPDLLQTLTASKAADAEQVETPGQVDAASGRLGAIDETGPGDYISQSSRPSFKRVDPTAMRQSIPSSMRRLPTNRNLGAALGVPCVICFGEEGVLKTLHCSYKVHVSCLKTYWSEKVVSLGRLTDIRCPAEEAGCKKYLDEPDLRGVVEAEDLVAAESRILDVADQNQQLIDELKRQNKEYRPMFLCAICLVEHEVEGCCTLPCQHRFCFESLQYHFDIIVRERRLSKLACPAEGCGYSLRTEECIHIFQQCLSEEAYHKLLEFLTRDDPHVYECQHLGCEERVFLDDGDDYADLLCRRGHHFCGKCCHGPHPNISCDEKQEQLDRDRKDEEDQQELDEAWRSALAMGWKPCPRRCTYGGGYKAAEECDHVTCECGFEFCWDCGVERQVPLLHDNRWHKPSCRYHTKPEEVAELPRNLPNCPECKKMSFGRPCCFPADDGYPESYISRRPAVHR
eukprot:CAMPEP_0172689738 /NCGR_PEP_ID=MMETSP1074-20121228/23362_1 /TAXON_ID=2916 /ORGANISM="Ceratium fusus, Strain PA161109" /LENGTH=1060 /DNA_ID=CAMNT_0013509587 /DNA_START=38 /DNA_END=3220 /DNA_ORIENTATION=+